MQLNRLNKKAILNEEWLFDLIDDDKK